MFLFFCVSAPRRDVVFDTASWSSCFTALRMLGERHRAGAWWSQESHPWEGEAPAEPKVVGSVARAEAGAIVLHSVAGMARAEAQSTFLVASGLSFRCGLSLRSVRLRAVQQCEENRRQQDPEERHPQHP